MEPVALSVLLGQSPLLITYIVGICVSIAFYQRRKTSALLSLVAFGIFLVADLGSIFSTQWLMSQISSGVEAAETSMLFAAVHLVVSAVHVIALVLLMVAIFIKTEDHS